MANSNRVRSEAVELYVKKNPVKEVKNKDTIHFNGLYNDYPYVIEGLINNSPTASMCAGVYSSYLFGQGFETVGDETWNSTLGLEANDILDETCEVVKYHDGCFHKILYDADFKPYLSVLEYKDCRKSKQDDNGFDGLLYISEWENKNQLFSRKKNKESWLYPFSKNKDVIKSQMVNDCKINGIKDPTVEQMINNFRGQWSYLNLTNYQYSISPIESVMRDVESEARISEYLNTHANTGFLGKVMIYTKGITPQMLDMVKGVIKGSLGSRNSNKVGVIDFGAKAQSIDFDNLVKIQQFEPQFDDKLFEDNTQRIIQQISGAFDGLPTDLIYSNSSLFSSGGEAYKQLKLAYQDNLMRKKMKIERYFSKITGKECDIKPLLTIEDSKDVQ